MIHKVTVIFYNDETEGCYMLFFALSSLSTINIDFKNDNTY